MPPRPPVKADDILAALDVQVDYDFEVKWNKQIDAAYKAGAPEDTKLALLGAIRAVFPVFIPGKTGAANAPATIKGSGAFVSSQKAPENLSGWYRLVVGSDTVELYGGDDVLWSGKGEHYGLEGTWRTYFR